MSKKWLRSPLEEKFRAKVFRYLTTIVENPKDSKTAVFDIIQCADWVNIIALNELDELILVRQYRAGSDSVTLETAAGAINYLEDPLAAAKRELCEETAYTSKEWISLGTVEVNPAIMTNRCFFFLAKKCIKDGTLNFDEMEDVETVIYSKEEVRKFIKSGEISHSLSSLALFKYFSYVDESALQA